MARFERRGRLAFASAVALAVPALIACNSIIGLSDFEKGECPGARCSDGGGFPDQITVDTGGDVRLDVSVDVKGADPVSWAKWEMPNYRLPDGGDGGPPRPPDLVLNADTVTDNITKLVWRTTLVPGSFKQADANAECKKLGTWRAPKRIELVTLLDYGKTSIPYIDSTKFPDVSNDRVWTTSEVRPFDPNKQDQLYWVVNFETGDVQQLARNLNARVLCVADK